MYTIQFSFDDEILDVQILEHLAPAEIKIYTDDVVAVCRKFKEKDVEFDLVVNIGNFILPQGSIEYMADWTASLKIYGVRKIILISAGALSSIQAKRIATDVMLVKSRAEADALRGA